MENKQTENCQSSIAVKHEYKVYLNSTHFLYRKYQNVYDRDRDISLQKLKDKYYGQKVTFLNSRNDRFHFRSNLKYLQKVSIKRILYQGRMLFGYFNGKSMPFRDRNTGQNLFLVKHPFFAEQKFCLANQKLSFTDQRFSFGNQEVFCCPKYFCRPKVFVWSAKKCFADQSLFWPTKK